MTLRKQLQQISSLSIFLLIFLSLQTSAEITIEITQGVDNPTPVAVSPFSWQGAEKLNEDIAQIIENDLRFSGRFDLLEREDMLSFPAAPQDVFYRDWRALGRDYLLTGQILPLADNKLEVRYYLFDVNRQKRIFGKKLTASKKSLRDIAHRIADVSFEHLTNIPGAFSSKILYVTGKFLGQGKYNYKLWVSDFDGERAKLILNSNEPILSPTWAPDGKKIAYVSFEKGRPAIFTQILTSGEREKLTNFKGMNSSPAFSPDGDKMAFVLSKDGSPDIYIMDLDSKKIRKLAANSYGIDTEPSWMPDGKSIVFTSNRGGKPQIYQAKLGDKNAKRLTYDGDYNARARVMPDGSGLILVNRTQGQFRIARYDMKRQRNYVLSNTLLDESPTIAPNGSKVMYAAKRSSTGVLAVVSVDGAVKSLLPSKASHDIREPAWSPIR